MTEQVVLTLNASMPNDRTTTLNMSLSAETPPEVRAFWIERFAEFQKLLDIQGRLEGTNASHTS